MAAPNRLREGRRQPVARETMARAVMARAVTPEPLAVVLPRGGVNLAEPLAGAAPREPVAKTWQPADEAMWEELAGPTPSPNPRATQA